MELDNDQLSVDPSPLSHRLTYTMPIRMLPDLVLPVHKYIIIMHKVVCYMQVYSQTRAQKGLADALSLLGVLCQIMTHLSPHQIIIICMKEHLVGMEAAAGKY